MAPLAGSAPARFEIVSGLTDDPRTSRTDEHHPDRLFGVPCSAGAATASGNVLLLSLKPASDPGSASAAGGAAPPVAAQSPQGGRGAGAAGTVTGDAASTQYGPVQVRLTVSGGKITKAEAVQAPRGGQSDRVTADACPSSTGRPSPRAPPTSTRSPAPPTPAPGT
ncbi:hypothetical protein STENM327S_04214 [Streptomyces tendae]